MTPDNGTQQAVATALKINWSTSPITMEDHLARIEILRERILDHVRFIAGVGTLEGTSGEAKQKAIGNLFGCLTTAERMLSRIASDARLA